MTQDLWMLLAAAGLQWILILLPAMANIATRGIPWALGNREATDTTSPAWLDRGERANRNMAENLPLFAILVLIAHVSGSADAMSAQGATIFVGARVAHAVIYIAGIPGLRTLAWLVSVVGALMVGASIVT